MKGLPQVNVEESSISESETQNEVWICYLEIIGTKATTFLYFSFLVILQKQIDVLRFTVDCL